VELVWSSGGVGIGLIASGEAGEPDFPGCSLSRIGRVEVDPTALTELVKLAPNRLDADLAKLRKPRETNRCDAARRIAILLAASGNVEADQNVLRVELVGDMRIGEATRDHREEVVTHRSSLATHPHAHDEAHGGRPRAG
jgi:hypothetical protein